MYTSTTVSQDPIAGRVVATTNPNQQEDMTSIPPESLVYQPQQNKDISAAITMTFLPYGISTASRENNQYVYVCLCLCPSMYPQLRDPTSNLHNSNPNSSRNHPLLQCNAMQCRCKCNQQTNQRPTSDEAHTYIHTPLHHHPCDRRPPSPRKNAAETAHIMHCTKPTAFTFTTSHISSSPAVATGYLIRFCPRPPFCREVQGCSRSVGA